MSKDLLAYRIPNKPSVEQLGSFKTMNNSKKKSIGFILTNFYGNNQFIFESNNQDIFEPSEYAIHLNKNQPTSISKERYIEQGKLALEMMPKLGIEKVVFSRIKTFSFNTNHYWKLYTILCETYPTAFVYLISSPIFGTWIGASPETLLESQGKKASTMSLAGTRELCEENKWNTKEQQEQQFVTDYITEELKNKGAKNICVKGPYTAPAGNVEHLRSDISFTLNQNHPLTIANSLHPTPAVNGVPKKQSKKLINKIELEDSNQDRGLYSGFMGLISESSSQLYVNLRCCQLTSDRAHVYVGGGYTLQSDVENEWEETERKSETLSRIFDLL